MTLFVVEAFAAGIAVVIVATFSTEAAWRLERRRVRKQTERRRGWMHR